MRTKAIGSRHLHAARRWRSHQCAARITSRAAEHDAGGRLYNTLFRDNPGVVIECSTLPMKERCPTTSASSLSRWRAGVLREGDVTCHVRGCCAIPGRTCARDWASCEYHVQTLSRSTSSVDRSVA